jgi:hypothetical protein
VLWLVDRERTGDQGERCRLPGLFDLWYPALYAAWNSPVVRQAHNLEVVGSNPTAATRSSNASTAQVVSGG